MITSTCEEGKEEVKKDALSIKREHQIFSELLSEMEELSKHEIIAEANNIFSSEDLKTPLGEIHLVAESLINSYKNATLMALNEKLQSIARLTANFDKIKSYFNQHQHNLKYIHQSVNVWKEKLIAHCNDAIFKRVIEGAALEHQDVLAYNGRGTCARVPIEVVHGTGYPLFRIYVNGHGYHNFSMDADDEVYKIQSKSMQWRWIPLLGGDENLTRRVLTAIGRI